MRKRTAKISFEVILDPDSFDDVIDLCIIGTYIQSGEFGLPIINYKMELDDDKNKLN